MLNTTQYRDTAFASRRQRLPYRSRDGKKYFTFLGSFHVHRCATSQFASVAHSGGNKTASARFQRAE